MQWLGKIVSCCIKCLSVYQVLQFSNFFLYERAFKYHSLLLAERTLRIDGSSNVIYMVGIKAARQVYDAYPLCASMRTKLKVSQKWRNPDCSLCRQRRSDGFKVHLHWAKANFFFDLCRCSMWTLKLNSVWSYRKKWLWNPFTSAVAVDVVVSWWKRTEWQISQTF